MLRYKQVVLRFCGDWSSLVNGLANDIHDPAQRLRSHRDSDRCTSIQNLLTTDQTLSTVHSDGAYSALPCWERIFFDPFYLFLHAILNQIPNFDIDKHSTLSPQGTVHPLHL